MFHVTKKSLSVHTPLVRYAYYLLSGCRLASFAAWRRRGEPNPFVRPSYERRQTQRTEFTEIFDEYRSAR